MSADEQTLPGGRLALAIALMGGGLLFAALVASLIAVRVDGFVAILAAVGAWGACGLLLGLILRTRTSPMLRAVGTAWVLATFAVAIVARASNG